MTSQIYLPKRQAQDADSLHVCDVWSALALSAFVGSILLICAILVS